MTPFQLAVRYTAKVRGGHRRGQRDQAGVADRGHRGEGLPGAAALGLHERAFDVLTSGDVLAEPDLVEGDRPGQADVERTIQGFRRGERRVRDGAGGAHGQVPALRPGDGPAESGQRGSVGGRDPAVRPGGTSDVWT
jgi:hypothetical protein